MLKKKADIQFWKIFFVEGVLYLAVSFLAIISASELNKLTEAKKIYLPKTSLQDFFFGFLFIAFFILVFVVYRKTNKFKKTIYRGLFILAVFWGGVVILNLFLPVFGSVFIMGALIILWLKLSTVWVHDVLIILGLAGTAGFFGLGFTPPAVIVLLLVFSVYDFVAVYKTKHMVLMAKDMIEKGVVLGFIIPEKLTHLKDKLSRVKQQGDFMILGGGDVVFPALLAVSVIPSGFLKALIITLFTLAGVFFSKFLFLKHKEADGRSEPIPALPTISLFAIVGYLVTLFF